jgi:succinate dehydrogenase/fumarate reductase flavoprotein subunit
MENNLLNIDDFEIEEYNSIVIGSGAAGLNCALHLVKEGLSRLEVAIITDKLGGGTSFNAGSDKQTYYKMAIVGDQEDSPFNMANDLMRGGAMHGDLALIEATNSIREFFHLIELGVPFPHDEYGAYVGYKTDYDPKQRATSIGPLTSLMMGNCLLRAVNDCGIPIHDNHKVIEILHDDSEEPRKAIGVICINKEKFFNSDNISELPDLFRIFKARNIIIATGGPAILYKDSVYPKSQSGMTSLAINAGCTLQNLTESQFGIASLKFRWNLSGSYQQVIPRYYSVDESGQQKEFLNELFPSFKELSRATFLKGYQWPFSPSRIENWGSSLIDLAVYHERTALGKKVYMDFTKNPSNYSDEDLSELTRNYLIKSDSLNSIPIERLKKLNIEAVNIYKRNKIDLEVDPIEIGICNQHLNGGISVDQWWESSISHIFAIGEVNGNHGVHRPGGSALNAGQIGGLRAAQKISEKYTFIQSSNEKKFKFIAQRTLNTLFNEIENAFNKSEKKVTLQEILEQIQLRMSRFGSIIRSNDGLKAEIKLVVDSLQSLELETRLKNYNDLVNYFQIKDSLLTQLFILTAISDYHANNGTSRGSYLILRENLAGNERHVIPPKHLKQYKFVLANDIHAQKIQQLRLDDGQITINWETVREIPKQTGSFENTWKKFQDKRIYN